MVERSKKCVLNNATSPFIVAVVAIITATHGCGGEVMNEEPSSSEGGGCNQPYREPVPSNQFRPGSYDGRRFLLPDNHLGDDLALVEGTAIRATGPGTIVWYGPANGYGELVVVIEHDLGTAYRFVNGEGLSVNVQKILTIYGHLRRSQARGGNPLSLQLGSYVDATTVVGFVNDDAHNGDGREHLHFGVRLTGVAEAKQADPRAWFRGYDSGGQYRGQFAAPSAVLQTLTLSFACTNTPATTTENQLNFAWTTPDGFPASRISLGGRIIGHDGSRASWQSWREVNNTATVSATIPLKACETFEFSVEFEKNNRTDWSCVGTNGVRGSVSGAWGSKILTPFTVTNGIGGCNLKLSVPCNTETPNPPQAAATQSIVCASDASGLSITVNGVMNERTLIDGNLSSVDFVAVGSNETGWKTSLYPSRHSAPFRSNAPVTITVPPTVRAFNLWAGSAVGARWFNLNNESWSVSGANCRLAPDNLGGHLIVR